MAFAYSFSMILIEIQVWAPKPYVVLFFFRIRVGWVNSILPWWYNLFKSEFRRTSDSIVCGLFAISFTGHYKESALRVQTDEEGHIHWNHNHHLLLHVSGCSWICSVRWFGSWKLAYWVYYTVLACGFCQHLHRHSSNWSIPGAIFYTMFLESIHLFGVR